MRRFPKFRDPRLALTTLQNPNIEVRTYAQLIQAARPFVAQPLLAVQDAARFSATQPPATPAAPIRFLPRRPLKMWRPLRQPRSPRAIF
jgi:hypothetical protein